MNHGPPPPDRYFPKTSWALLADACDASPAFAAAREEFARRYHRPVRDFLAAACGHREDADDLAQGFFADVVITGKLLAGMDRTRGSFRPYLKQAVRNYAISQMRRRNRLKRRAAGEVRPDAWSDQGWDRVDARGTGSPEAQFHQAWVRELLERALAEVRSTCDAKNQQQHLRLFLGRYLSDDPDPPSWRVLGAEFELDEKTARARAETVARHFRVALRRLMIAETGARKAADEEIAALLAALEE